MNKKMMKLVLLCTIGVMGVSPSVLAGNGCSGMSSARIAEIERAERERVLAEMDASRNRGNNNTEVRIHAVPAPAPVGLRCGICEQFKQEDKFPKGRELQWDCNRLAHKQHFICYSCINSSQTCDICYNENMVQQRGQAYSFASAPTYPPLGVNIEPNQVPPGGINFSVASGGVQVSVQQAQAPAPQTRAELAPMTREIPQDDELVIYFQRMGSGTRTPIRIARKLINEDGWTIANLRRKLIEEVRYDGPFLLNNRTWSDDVLLSNIAWENGVTTIFEKRQLLGGEEDLPFESEAESMPILVSNNR